MVKDRLARLGIVALMASASLSGGEPISLTTKKGESVIGELTRVAPEGIVVTTPDGVRRIRWAELPEEVARKYASDAMAAEESEIDRLRAEVARLRAENDLLRQRLGLETGVLPSADAETADAPMPQYEEKTESTASIQAKISMLQGHTIPEARRRLDRLQSLHAAKADEEREKRAEYYSGKRDTIWVDGNKAKREKEIRDVTEDIASLEAELSRLKGLVSE